jgi:Tol biopolymer transport system component
MTAPTRLERDLIDWLSETAMPQTPDYVDDILAKTSRIHQRPRWSFVGRWLPIGNLSRIVPISGRTALRGVALIVVLSLLLAAIAAFVGSRRSVPPPFGPAGNGLLAYEQAGAIQIIHPETMASQPVVTDSGNHHDPRWALDGTRLAFVRESAGRQVLVVADAAGRVLAVSQAFRDVDPDAIAWSPDGRQIAIGAARGQGRAIYLVDAVDGTLRDLGVDYDNLETFWRPPDGRQLLFHTGGAEPGLRVVNVVDGTVERVPPDVVDPTLRPLGWAPNGKAFLYQQAVGSLREWTYVADVKTGTLTRLDVAFGHVSNDGTRVAGLDAFDRPCVVAITGGACRAIADAPGWIGTTGAAVSWSPDDRWIAIHAPDTGSIWLVDPTGALPSRQVPSTGPVSWQRMAP